MTHPVDCSCLLVSEDKEGMSEGGKVGENQGG